MIDREPSALTYSLRINPVIVSDDDGCDPAPCRIEQKYAKAFYAATDVAIDFLPCRNWHCTTARDGLADLDSIVEMAESAGLIDNTPGVINLFFINGVEGAPGPLGRAMQGGNITFIAMAPEPDRGQDAFVIIHEIGHNLGLLHVVDDPDIENGPPNIMGDGDYFERVDPANLVEKQIQTIRNSGLLQTLEN